MPPTRISYLDIAKGFTLILMVYGHCVIPFHHLATAIYMFHMPLFFVACGFLAMPITHFDTKKKFRKIIIPYLIVFALSIIPYYLKYHNLDVLWIFPLMKARSLAGYDGDFGIGPIWFLPCYFLSNLCIAKLQKHLSYEGIFSLSLTVFTALYAASKLLGGGGIFLLWQTSLGVCFIILGYKCKLKNYLANKTFLVIGILSTIACLYRGGLSMYSMVCRLWILQIIAGLFTTLIVFECAKKIGSCRPLEWISRNSLTILCIHSYDWTFGFSEHVREMTHLTSHWQFFFYLAFIALGLALLQTSRYATKKLTARLN